MFGMLKTFMIHVYITQCMKLKHMAQLFCTICCDLVLPSVNLSHVEDDVNLGVQNLTVVWAVLFLCLCHMTVGEGIMFLNSPSTAFIRLFRQILLPRHLMNGLSNLDETYRDYSLDPTDDLIRFWRSKVKVTTGHGKGMHVDAGASKSHVLVAYVCLLHGLLAMPSKLSAYDIIVSYNSIMLVVL